MSEDSMKCEGVPQERINFKYLYLSVFSLCLGSFANGCMLGWSSPTIPKLDGLENPLETKPTSEEVSLMASMLAIGSIFSPLYSSYLTDLFGRKPSVLITQIPLLAGLVLVPIATQMWVLYIARFLCGLGFGSALSILPPYVAEISVNENRGKLMSVIFIMLNTGVLFAYCVGPFVTVTILPVIFMAPTLLFFLLTLLLVPESPHYLIAKGLNNRARDVLKYLRGNEAEEEFAEIEKFVAQSESASLKDFLTLATDRSLLKRILLVLTLLFFQQVSGVSGLLFYLQPILKSAETDLNDDLSSIAVGAANVFATLMAPLFVDTYGRKFLLYVSSGGTCVSMLTLGLFFYFKNNDGPAESVLWLPIVSLIVFLLSYSLGLGSIPLTILGEILPTKYKAPGITVCIAILALISFLVTLLFPIILEDWGEEICFWMFAAFMVCCAAFVYFAVPETKGKSFLEIEKLFYN